MEELLFSGIGAGGGASATFFLMRWLISNEIKKSEEKIKQELIGYVDKKHDSVVMQLNEIKDMLNRIDQRIFEMLAIKK